MHVAWDMGNALRNTARIQTQRKGIVIFILLVGIGMFLPVHSTYDWRSDNVLIKGMNTNSKAIGTGNRWAWPRWIMALQ